MNGGCAKLPMQQTGDDQRDGNEMIFWASLWMPGEGDAANCRAVECHRLLL